MAGMRLLFLAITVAFVGCSNNNNSGSSSGGNDLATGPDMQLNSSCGRPGDTGNNFGVGQFCTKAQDCSSNSKAQACSAAFNFLMLGPPTYYCTLTGCDPAVASSCGDQGAYCLCVSGGCACVPGRCPPPADMH
jgi:hypothetical protein